MTTIHLNKSPTWHTVFINNDPPNKVISVIDKALSYEIPSSENIQPTMNEETGEMELWDGIVHLLGVTRNGAYYFPAGLRPKVTKILEAYGYDVAYAEKQRVPRQIMDLGWYVEPLYDYQQDQVKQATEILRHDGIIIPLPTGAGKTRTAMKLIQQYGVKTLIIVHTKELVKQWKENIESALHVKPARYDGSHKEIGNITIAMIQTATRHLKTLINSNFDMVISDEVHRAPSSTYYKTLIRLDAAYRIGLTATPYREDHAEMKFVGVIGEVLEQTSTPQELMDSGHLARATLEFINVPPAPGGTNWKQWQTAYTMGITGNKLRNELIAKRSAQLLREGKSVYIHVERIMHGQQLRYMIGKEAKFIEAKSKNREQVIQEFKDGTLRCMISTLLKEGADIPSMDAIIMAGGGKSHVAVIQKAGRALRVTKDKKEALIIDFMDQGKWLRDHSQERRQILEKTFT